MIPYVTLEGTLLAAGPNSVRLQVEDSEIEIPHDVIIEWRPEEGWTRPLVTKVYELDVYLGWARKAGLLK